MEDKVFKQPEHEALYGEQLHFPFDRSVKDQAEESMRGHFAPSRRPASDADPSDAASLEDGWNWR